jgi:hypothetical protein
MFSNYFCLSCPRHGHKYKQEPKMNPQTSLVSWTYPNPLPPFTPEQEARYFAYRARKMEGDLRPYHPDYPYIFSVGTVYDWAQCASLKFVCLQCNVEWLFASLSLHLNSYQFLESIEREFAPHKHPQEPQEILDPSGIPLAYEPEPVG